jgi:hypothetical protein
MATRIHKRKSQNTYVVYFVNPINKENTQIGSFTDLKKAIELARDKDSDFYSKHPYLIPSGITLDKANRRFRVYTRYGVFKSHKTLMQAVEQKQNIISDLTEMKYIDTGKNSVLTNAT